MDHGPVKPSEASRPMTDLQRMLASSVEEQHERLQKQRTGGPDDLPELERELTMVVGALHGVQQRAAELVAELRPVSDITEGHSAPSMPIAQPDLSTEYAGRLREVQTALSELEALLSQARFALRA